MWTLACIMWSIIAQRPLFEGFLATEDDMTTEHVDALGILPPEWWAIWEARADRFTKDGVPLNRNPFRSWDDRFEDSMQQPRQDSGIPPFGPEERKAVSSMLRAMLSFKPEGRLTAKQVLESEWMLKWALPCYYGVKLSNYSRVIMLFVYLVKAALLKKELRRYIYTTDDNEQEMYEISICKNMNWVLLFPWRLKKPQIPGQALLREFSEYQQKLTNLGSRYSPFNQSRGKSYKITSQCYILVSYCLLLYLLVLLVTP